MTPSQRDAFYAASGMHASGTTFDIRLIAGGILLICSLVILVGLMHYLNSTSLFDKNTFLVSVFVLAFILMLGFMYIA